MQPSETPSTSNLATLVRMKDRERQRLAADIAKFKGEVTIAQSTAKAHDHAESKTTQERDELSFKRAEVIKSERAAADKARKARPPIRTLATVIRRHKKRSAAQ